MCAQRNTRTERLFRPGVQSGVVIGDRKSGIVQHSTEPAGVRRRDARKIERRDVLVKGSVVKEHLRHTRYFGGIPSEGILVVIPGVSVVKHRIAREHRVHGYDVTNVPTRNVLIERGAGENSVHGNNVGGIPGEWIGSVVARVTVVE